MTPVITAIMDTTSGCQLVMTLQLLRVASAVAVSPLTSSSHVTGRREYDITQWHPRVSWVTQDIAFPSDDITSCHRWARPRANLVSSVPGGEVIYSTLHLVFGRKFWAAPQTWSPSARTYDPFQDRDISCDFLRLDRRNLCGRHTWWKQINPLWHSCKCRTMHNELKRSHFSWIFKNIKKTLHFACVLRGSWYLYSGFELTGGLGGLTPQFPCSFHCDPPTPQPLSSCCVADPPSSFFTIRTLLILTTRVASHHVKGKVHRANVNSVSI